MEDFLVYFYDMAYAGRLLFPPTELKKVNLESLIPAEHLTRKIKVVINPVMLFKMMVSATTLVFAQSLNCRRFFYTTPQSNEPL